MRLLSFAPDRWAAFVERLGRFAWVLPVLLLGVAAASEGLERILPAALGLMLLARLGLRSTRPGSVPRAAIRLVAFALGLGIALAGAAASACVLDVLFGDAALSSTQRDHARFLFAPLLGLAAFAALGLGAAFLRIAFLRVDARADHDEVLSPMTRRAE